MSETVNTSTQSQVRPNSRVYNARRFFRARRLFNKKISKDLVMFNDIRMLNWAWLF